MSDLDAMLAALPEAFYRQYAPWWKGPTEDLLDGKSVDWPPTQESLWKMVAPGGRERVTSLSVSDLRMPDIQQLSTGILCSRVWICHDRHIDTPESEAIYAAHETAKGALLRMWGLQNGYRWTGEKWEKEGGKT